MEAGMTQLELLTRDKEKAAKLLDRMLSILSDGSWVKGKYLCAVLHTNERIVRRIADLSAGQIISSDQGYRLIRYASLDEIEHAQARLLSQAKKMQERALQYERAKHGRSAA